MESKNKNKQRLKTKKMQIRGVRHRHDLFHYLEILDFKKMKKFNGMCSGMKCKMCNEIKYDMKLKVQKQKKKKKNLPPLPDRGVVNRTMSLLPKMAMNSDGPYIQFKNPQTVEDRSNTLSRQHCNIRKKGPHSRTPETMDAHTLTHIHTRNNSDRYTQ